MKIKIGKIRSDTLNHFHDTIVHNWSFLVNGIKESCQIISFFIQIITIILYVAFFCKRRGFASIMEMIFLYFCQIVIDIVSTLQPFVLFDACFIGIVGYIIIIYHTSSSIAQFFMSHHKSAVSFFQLNLITVSFPKHFCLNNICYFAPFMKELVHPTVQRYIFSHLLFVYFIQELKKRQEITLTGTIRTNKYINLPQFKCYVLKGFIPFYTNFLHLAYIYIFSKGRKKKWNEQDLLPYY